MWPRTLMLAGVMTLACAVAGAQNPEPSPQGQVPGPNATQAGTPTDKSPLQPHVQPVPGAMPGSDDVPSTLSEKNARDDELPVAAYRLKTLTDQQRQAIYQSVVGNTRSGRSAAAAGAHSIEVGMVLPPDAPLDPLPTGVANMIPATGGLRYQMVGDKLVLADPLYRQVLAVIGP